VNASATPLISLQAVALDIETTGLDARTARMIEIAVVRIDGPKVDAGAALELLIDPGIPMPASATRIHGLTNRDLETAPSFAAIEPAIQKSIGRSVVIGHNIGYDLAVLDREYARAEIRWTIPRFLDVRALARLAAPDLASHELDALCDLLGIKIEGRHRALPDALRAAHVFQHLIPLLRARGIRTLAEAELATRHLPGEERLFQIGGWVSAYIRSADPAPVIAAIDSYPFRHRICDLTLQPAVFVAPSADLHEAVHAVLTESAKGLAIVGHAQDVRGVVTTAELLSALATPAIDASHAPGLSGIKLQTLPTVGEDEFLYRALARLQRHNAAYLGVVNSRGHLIGTLAASDLLRHRVTSALVLGDEIDAAQTVADLGRAWAKIPNVVMSSLSEEIEPPNIAGIISAEIRALTARAASMAEERMMSAGKGSPPCPYAVLVLGSAGRGDSLLSADQDNAIVYASGELGGAEDLWFAEAGTHIADILNEVGIPYCPGGVMAKNPGCRHDVRTWKLVIGDWVSRAQVEDLLAADIFFDGVPVHGDLGLANEIFDFAFTRAEASPMFIEGLASFAKSWYPPIGFFGRLVLESDGRLDLKRNGLLPIVTAARTLALKYMIRPTSTLARLKEVKARALANGDMIERAMTAYASIMREVLAQQIQDAHQGIRVSTRVHVGSMASSKRAMLKRSMQAINELIATTLNL
jgi:DNA polymerase-3 subunit epsilon/CBS domain-containing protein